MRKKIEIILPKNFVLCFLKAKFSENAYVWADLNAHLSFVPHILLNLLKNETNNKKLKHMLCIKEIHTIMLNIKCTFTV